jgi:3-oxoacyl-[acyl-carrier-protein] synthase-3
MGIALPGDAVGTDALLDRVENKFGLNVGERGRAIARKLGIMTRHLCRPLEAPLEAPRAGHRNPELAAAAVRDALLEAGLRTQDLSYLIGHTATPAQSLPPNIGQVAELLDHQGPFVEFRQACTGFANALIFASGLLRAGAGPVAIVGSETGSVFFDPRRIAEDKGQLVNLLQMGDAAAAIVLTRYDGSEGATLSRVFYGQAGRGRAPGLAMSDGGSDAPVVRHRVPEFRHDFVAIRKRGPNLLLRCAQAAFQAGIDNADRVLPHQANGRMDTLLASLLRTPRERILMNGDRVGNTGSAAMWLGLAQTRAQLRRSESVMALGAEATDYMFGGFLYVHG